MKKILFLATALVMLASCADENFVGDNTSPTSHDNGAIAFTTSSKAITRSDDATAGKLNNNFVVFGYKTVGSTVSTVFDNYQVNWVTNTAGTTESNSANWEYVGYKNLPGGVTTNVGVTAFSALTGSGQANENAIEQSIKYWDFSASSYDFFAYSLGIGVTDASSTTWAKASALSNSTYTLEGTAAQLGTCYISNKKNVVPSASATEVDLEFRSFLSQIELKFYETIPGYSVKSLSFYPSSTGSSSTTPYLYTSSKVLPIGGKYTITFDSNGKAQLSFSTSEGSPTYASNIAFSSTLTNYKGAEYKEATASYLGRASNEATSTNTITSLPNPNANALNLKMDFTLVSRDGTGEEISCTGATAVIPADYAKWSPNYKYTYIFKISDNTNAQIGAITGLYPITLDAVVIDSEDGVQETITTVSAPSITTYAKGKVVTSNNEYVAGVPIYIIVNNGTANVTLTGNNAKLYTVTLAKSTDDGDTPAASASQPISEESVANVLANGTKDNPTTPTTWTVKDANKWKMVVTKSDLMSLPSAIAAEDSPTGNEISLGTTVGKFTPAAGTTYVFQYEVKAAEAAGTHDAASAAAYNATLPGAISTTDVAYSFNSYGSADDSTPYGSGKVKRVSQKDGWTTVLVTHNTPVDQNAVNFVGQQFKVNATTITENTYYPLYTTGGTPTGVYVKVESATYTADEVKSYNATLPGAAAVGDTKPAVPAKYQYKVIKVAAGS